MTSTLTPNHVARDGEVLWLYSMGKRFQVTAIFTTDAEANAHMEKHDSQAVIAAFGPFIVLANKYEGVK